jgi:signal transduction histidine kinase
MQRGILLVEDQATEAARIRTMIATHSVEAWEVVHSPTLAAAERLLEERAFALVLLDLSIPDSRGLATLERLRARLPDTAVVVFTGMSDEEIGLEALRAGAQDYLAKDRVDGPTLVRAIRYALERRRADAAERQRVALQEAVSAMEEVLAVVSHELRAPLAAQQLACEYLLTERPTPLERQRYLGIMQSQVRRMHDTISDVLDAARMEKGAARWQWGTVDGASLCESALESVTLLVNPELVALTLRVEPDGLRFSGDDAAVRRLLVNLLVNASKHTDTGEIELAAREVVRDGSRWVLLSVSDSGRGIQEEAVEKLGIPFALSTAEGPAHRHGSGLGLAICRGIAAAHGGEITFDSRPGGGTTFCASLRADLAGPMKGRAMAGIRRIAA